MWLLSLKLNLIHPTDYHSFCQCTAANEVRPEFKIRKITCFWFVSPNTHRVHCLPSIRISNGVIWFVYYHITAITFAKHVGSSIVIISNVIVHLLCLHSTNTNFVRFSLDKFQIIVIIYCELLFCVCVRARVLTLFSENPNQTSKHSLIR